MGQVHNYRAAPVDAVIVLKQQMSQSSNFKWHFAQTQQCCSPLGLYLPTCLILSICISNHYWMRQWCTAWKLLGAPAHLVRFITESCFQYLGYLI